MPQENILHHSALVGAIENERRRSKRLFLQVPLFVRGLDSRGEQFLELGKTLNIGAMGALVACPLAPRIGDTVTLTVPSPSITSSALVPAQMSPVQAMTLRQQAVGDVYVIAFEFLRPIG